MASAPPAVQVRYCPFRPSTPGLPWPSSSESNKRAPPACALLDRDAQEGPRWRGLGVPRGAQGAVRAVVRSRGLGVHGVWTLELLPVRESRGSRADGPGTCWRPVWKRSVSGHGKDGSAFLWGSAPSTRPEATTSPGLFPRVGSDRCAEVPALAVPRVHGAPAARGKGGLPFPCGGTAGLLRFRSLGLLLFGSLHPPRGAQDVDVRRGRSAGSRGILSSDTADAVSPPPSGL